MANKFIKFIIEIKEKFPEGISNNDFERLLLKNNESFLFIKKIVKNIEKLLCKISRYKLFVESLFLNLIQIECDLYLLHLKFN